jgi:Flp pilus assembly protein TadG
MEFLLVLPVLLIVVLGIIELGMLFDAREKLRAACRDGARVAALGGNELEVEIAVRRHLVNSALNGATVEMSLRNDLGRPLPAGAPVLVAVTAPAGLAAPDLLSMIGFSLDDQVIEVCTVMRKE